MSGHPLLRLRNPALLLALASVFPAFSYAAGAARIDFTAGPVTAVSATGAQRPLGKGAEIGNGETIRTGDDARAQLRFSDGALVSLQPKTEFRIDNYQYAGQPDGKEQGFFSLLRGGLRTITGWVGRSNREAYKVKTQVATIGIRGTGYKTALDETGNELLIGTSEGEVEVCNDAGCIILASGENGVVQGTNAPRRTGNQALLSPALLAQIPPLPGFSSGEDRNADGSYSALGGSQSPLVGTQTLATVYANIDTYGCCIGTFSFAGVGTGTLDASGALTSFTAGEGADPNIAGGNTVHSSGNDGLVAWGKWIDNGNGFNGFLSGGEGGFLYYVTGVPTSESQAALGGSSGIYTVIGGGVGGSSSGPGTITGGALNANFTTAKVDIGLTASVNSNSYTLGATNIPIVGFGSAVGFNVSGAIVMGGGCSTPCNGAMNGYFVGAGAPRAGVSFSFSDGQDIAGAVAFKRN